MINFEEIKLGLSDVYKSRLYKRRRVENAWNLDDYLVIDGQRIAIHNNALTGKFNEDGICIGTGHRQMFQIREVNQDE